MVQFLGKVETAYLDTLKAAVLQEKQRSYDCLALEPGGSVLEVGCGPATDTLALADLVGASGRIVGIDFDPDMVAQANERARSAGLEAQVTHLVADASALPFADGEFHATRSERVFQHVPNPAAVLAEMARVTRPGGRVVVFDTDHGTVVVDSTEPVINERLMRFRLDTMFTNPGSGRQLYRLFREAGLGEVSVERGPWPHSTLASSASLQTRRSSAPRRWRPASSPPPSSTGGTPGWSRRPRTGPSSARGR